jgi:DNA-directed RNA polymerase subunit RPC12/RpoP
MKQLRCPRCGGDNVFVQADTETTTKHRGCLAWALWILLAIVTIGLIIIIPLITNSKTKSKTKTQAVCQTCGQRWNT